MDFDDILQDVGDYGRYQQLLLWFVFLPAHLPFGCHAYSQLFMSLTPEHWCRSPASEKLNVSDAKRRELSVPPYSGGQSRAPGQPLNFSQCYMYDISPHELWASKDPNTSWPTTECQYGWVYNRSWLGEDQSVVTQWDLVCLESWLPSLALSLFHIGGCVGQCLYCLLAYKFGRRICFFLFLSIQSSMGIAAAFAPTFGVFSLIRLGVGLTAFSVISTPGKLALELTGKSHRVRILLLLSAARGVGVCLLAGVAFLIRDWSHLALSTSVPFAAFLLYWWVLPESPRWLLSRGRYEMVGQMLTSVAQTNGKCLPPDYILALKRRFRIESAIQSEHESIGASRTGYGFGDLFETPNLRKKTLALTLIWFVNTTVYLGLTYYSFEQGDLFYMSFLLSALAEVAAVALVSLFLHRTGRRCAICLSCSIGGVMCLCIYGNRQGTKTTRLLLYVLCKIAISSSSTVLPIWAGELLPLVAKDVGLEIMELISLLGPALLPPLMYQGKTHPILPLAMLSGLQFCAAIASMTLPETQYHRTHNQSMQEAEEFGKYWTWTDCFRIKPLKSEPRNGILKNKGPPPQSPILSLLRRQETLRRCSSEGEFAEISDLEDREPNASSSPGGSSTSENGGRCATIETIKVTVL